MQQNKIWKKKKNHCITIMLHQLEMAQLSSVHICITTFKYQVNVV